MLFRSLKNLLGTVLYDYLAGEIEARVPFTGRYYELMEDYVKPCLIWYTCTEYIPFSSVQFKSNGAVKQRSEQGEAPSKAEIDYLREIARNNADYWALRLQNFCISYSQDLPEYLESVGNQTQIYPDQTNQYFSGVQL